MGELHRREWPVRITTLGPIQGGTVAFVEAGITYVTVVVKATFALVHEGFIVQTAPEPLVLADENLPGSESLERPSDLAPFVPAVDVILRGRAHGAEGALVPAVATRLVMTSSEVSGAEVLIDKTVHVYGKRPRLGAFPDSFASFPIVYDFAERPAPDAAFGVKAGEVPNLVLPNGERGYAGFGPISPSWPDRQAFLEGATIDATVREGATILDLGSASEDGAFPFEFYQVSPPDQRLTGLEGGEWIVIDGMHRDLPRFATKLPHMRAEAQLYDPEGRPLPMHLVCDTLAIDMEARTMNALFRGNIPAPPGPLDALSVVATLEVLANEDLDRSVSSFGSGASFADLSEDSEPPPPQVAKAPLSAPPPRSPSAAPTHASIALDDTPLPESVDAVIEALEDPDSDAGDKTSIAAVPMMLDVETPNLPPDPPPKTVPPPPTSSGSGDIPFRALGGDAARAPVRAAPRTSAGLPFAEVPAAPAVPNAMSSAPLADEPTPDDAVQEPTTGLPFERPPIPPPRVPAPDHQAPPLAFAAGEARDPKLDAPQDDDEPPTRMRASLPEIVVPPSPHVPSAGALDAPTTVDENDPRAVVLRRLAKGEALYDANYAGADLSGIDFRGAALTGINLTHAKLERCRFDGARLASAKLAGADLRNTTFVGAELGQADLSKCKLANARFDEARLDDANLGLVDAPGASFLKAVGQRVALAQGQFHDARFDGASLTFADCSGADLAGASFEGASLASARFADVRGRGVRFDGADLDQASFVGAQLEEASFDRASLRTATLERAKLEGCSFREAKLGKAVLARSTIDGCTFARADLEGANFIHASGQQGDFGGASLVAADLRQTKLSEMTFEGADLRRLNAHKAQLVGARFDGANLTGASLRGAKLRGSSLARADLADADLRDADLENAKLVGIVHRDRAKLGGANLKGAEDDAPADPPSE
ncbi:MAG: pentapeptide repeat-containing protein [Polyangiaceae bacterium]